MRSEILTTELASIIRRLQHRIESTPRYAALLDVDTQDEALAHVLEGIEDAIAGLVVLHIKTRERFQ